MSSGGARLAVLASGAGTTFAALLEASADRLPAAVVLLISNRRACGAMQIARARGVPCLHLSSVTHADPRALDGAIAAALTQHRVDLVVLTGYLKQLGPLTLERFAGRIVNTHPSLLPRFGGTGMYGEHVHAAVLAAGERETGATVHYVTGEYDSGPILAQARIPVGADDSVASLEARVKQAEKTLLIDTLAHLLQDS